MKMTISVRERNMIGSQKICASVGPGTSLSRSLIASTRFRSGSAGNLRRNRLPFAGSLHIDVRVTAQALEPVPSGPQAGGAHQGDLPVNSDRDLFQFVINHVR